jgi:hypothetical protein
MFSNRGLSRKAEFLSHTGLTVLSGVGDGMSPKVGRELRDP